MHGPQAGRARLAAHPRHDLIEQQRDEEHPFGVPEVRDREHGHPRLALRRIEQARRVERIAFEPLRESRRGKQPVEAHRQIEAVLRRKKRLEIDDTNLGEGRRLHLLDERGEIEIAAVRPGGPEEAGDERVLPAAGRSSRPASDSTLVAVLAARSAMQLAVAPGRGWRSREGTEDRDRAHRRGCPACRS